MFIVASGCDRNPFALCEPGVDFLWRAGARPDRVGPLEYVRYEPGFPLLSVDEECHYVAYSLLEPGGQALVREGTLSREDAAALSSELDLAAVFESPGNYQGDAIDGGTTEFGTQGAVTRCVSSCLGGGVPSHIRDANRGAAEWVRTLVRQGEVPDGPLRVMTARLPQPGPTNFEVTPWPLATPIDVLAVPYEELEPYTSPVLSDPEDVLTLRSLRDEYASGAHGFWGYGFLPIDDPEAVDDVPDYAVVLRDVMSIEDEVGFVPLPE